jgi:hypothetical protein
LSGRRYSWSKNFPLKTFYFKRILFSFPRIRGQFPSLVSVTLQLCCTKEGKNNNNNNNTPPPTSKIKQTYESGLWLAAVGADLTAMTGWTEDEADAMELVEVLALLVLVQSVSVLLRPMPASWRLCCWMICCSLASSFLFSSSI